MAIFEGHFVVVSVFGRTHSEVLAQSPILSALRCRDCHRWSRASASRLRGARLPCARRGHAGHPQARSTNNCHLSV